MRFICPVGAQGLKTAELFIKDMDDEATLFDREQRQLGPEDKLVRLECSVGGCAIRATLEQRITPCERTTSFEVINPQRCKLRAPYLFP